MAGTKLLSVRVVLFFVALSGAIMSCKLLRPSSSDLAFQASEFQVVTTFPGMAEILRAIPYPPVNASDMEREETNKVLRTIFDNAKLVLANPDLNIRNYTEADVLAFYHGYQRLASYLTVNSIITDPLYRTEGKYENKALVSNLIAVASGAMSVHHNPFAQGASFTTAEFRNAIQAVDVPAQASSAGERVTLPGAVVLDIQTAAVMQLFEILWFYQRLLLGPERALDLSCNPQGAGESLQSRFPVTGANGHYQQACLDFFANLNQDKNLPATLMGSAQGVLAEVQTAVSQLNALKSQLRTELYKEPRLSPLEALNNETIEDLWERYQAAYQEFSDSVVGRLIFSNQSLAETFGSPPFHSLAELKLPTNNPSYWTGRSSNDVFAPHRSPFTINVNSLENALVAAIAAANKGIDMYATWEVSNIAEMRTYGENKRSYSVDVRAISSDAIAEMISRSPMAVGMVLGSIRERDIQISATQAVGQIIRATQDKAAKNETFIDWINYASFTLMAVPILGAAAKGIATARAISGGVMSTFVSGTKAFGSAYWHSMARARFYVPMIASSGVSLLVFENKARTLSQNFYQSMNLWNQIIIASDGVSGDLNASIREDAQHIRMQTVFFVMGNLLMLSDATYIMRLGKTTLTALNNTDGGVKRALTKVKERIKQGTDGCLGLPVRA